MLQYIEKPEDDCVITFGVSGWSSYLFASWPKGYAPEKIYDLCSRRIPDHIKKSHPANEKIKWIKVYRLESHERFP